MTNKELPREDKALILEASIDAMIEMNPEIGLKKLPVVNSKTRKYIAQYVDTQFLNVFKNNNSWFPPERRFPHVVIYRVMDYGTVNRYFFPFNTINFKNLNSLNGTIGVDSMSFFKSLKKTRKNLYPITEEMSHVLPTMESNLKYLVDIKLNPDRPLKNSINKLTGLSLATIPDTLWIRSASRQINKNEINKYIQLINEWAKEADLKTRT